MTFWELRVFIVQCDHPGCPAEARVECRPHVLEALPAGWVALYRNHTDRRTELRCPAHTEEGTG